GQIHWDATTGSWCKVGFDEFWHRATKRLSFTWSRRSCLAGTCGGAAADNPGSWLSCERFGGCLYENRCFLPQRFERSGLYRKQKSADRISMGRFSVRETSRARCGTGEKASERHFCNRQCRLCACGQVGDHEH